MFLISRRIFLKDSFLTTAVLVMTESSLHGAVSPLDTLKLLQEDLVPNTLNTPTTEQINSSLYISLILQHSRIKDEDKLFIRNGVQWLNEEALEVYKKTYTQLTSAQREEVLKSISKYRWGENWIERMLTYIFEAMLGDPIYGVNKNGVGWRWLNHEAGLPRPHEAVL